MLSLIIQKLLKPCTENRFVDALFKGIKSGTNELMGRFSRFLLRVVTKVENNKVLFHTQEDKYCCNQKYLCEEFRRRGLGDKLDLVYVIPKKGGRGTVPMDVRVVKRGTFEYFKEMFSAKYIFTNSILYKNNAFRLKKKQVLIETWHGSLGIKRFDRNSFKGSIRWVWGAIATGKMTTYCISNSTFEDEVYKNSYWPKTPSLRYGHPRNDIMFDSYAEHRAAVKATFLAEHELAEDTRFILYAPTFRDTKNFECYDIDVEGVLNAAKERFGGEWKMLLRYHLSVRNVYKKKDQLADAYNEMVIDVTRYDDMQELMTIADIAITDYSSWIYDFVLQRRPGFIFATDVALYNNERGFCYPLEQTPFAIAINNKQLVRNILDFEQSDYLNKVETFLEDKGCVEDGHASERTVDLVLKLMNEC